jgi:leader peptidase (prepilin peptidase) / N-methyltransferase
MEDAGTTAGLEAETPARLSARAHVASLTERQRLAAGGGAAALAVASFVRFGFSGHALVGAIFASVLVLLTVIDLDRRLLPDAIVLPTLAVVLALQLAFYPQHALEWVLAAVGAALFFFVPMLIYPAGMGMGDVKLAALMGAALGKAVIGAVFAGLVAASAVGLLIILRQGAGARKKSIPFGPFLALGGVVVLLLGGR